ncbi:hypothetical protein ACTFIY_008411 [Dictyostelium cf. discoideum]
MKQNKINKPEISTLSTVEENAVAIVGVGFRLPSGSIENERNNTPQSLWNNLINGFDGVVKTSERFNDNFFKNHEIANNYSGLLPLDEVKSFDPLFFGINPNEAPTIDPIQRLLLKCTWEALEDSLIDPISIKGTDTSVFIGCTESDYHNINKNEVKSNVFSSLNHAISNRVSYCYDLHGNSITLDTACSSSLNAISLGYDSIKNKKSKMSIVGGVNILLDSYFFKAYSSLNILSKSNGRCKSFDASADGYVRSECIGVVILKNLKDAIKDGNRIYCTINGASSNVDGIGYSDKSNFYSPSSISQSENLKNAIQSTNGTVKPSDIDYVEAHGTGTPTGDPIEVEGISKVFKDTRSTDTPLLIGSFKSNIGHCEAASGIASLIKCCLMFKNKCFAPNIHFKTPNPAIKFKEWNLKVVTEPIPFNQNKNTSMVVNNFGATGSNCCLVLSQFNYNNNNNNINNNYNNTKTNNYLIPFSANSVESLKKYQSLIIENKEYESKYSFEEFVKNQIYNKSTSLYQRSVIVAKDWNDFNNVENQIKYQTSSSTSSNITITNKNNNPITVFVFCGQGSQYNTMALELYKNEKVFKNSMDTLDNKMKNYFGYSILEKLRSIQDNDKHSVHEQTIAQPSTVMVQVSLYELYKHWGIKASFMLGHSLGEVTTAYCSGMIDIDQLCYLVYHRSTLQIRTNGSGKMLSINISSDEYKNNYMSRYPTIEIACYNSPSSIVIGGKEQILNEISKELKEKEIFSAMLGSLSSFHTSSQNIIKDDILNLNIQSNQPVIPTFSTVTSNLFNESTIFNSEYFFDNISKPVSFTETISNLYKHIEDNQIGSNIVFIEIAPHPTLSFYLKQMIPKQSQYFRNGESISVYSALHKKKNDVEEFQKSISQLFCDNSYEINFKCQFNNINNNIEGINDLNLPLYQWDDQQYWLNKSIEHKNNLIGPPISILGNSMQDSNPFIKSYQTIIDTGKDAFKYLKGHNVSDKCYFPGTGYIDNIFKLYPNQDLTINSIEFKVPFVLTDGIGQYLQTNVYQTGKSEYRAQFHLKDEMNNQWINTSNSNFHLNSSGNDNFEEKQKLDIQDIKQTKCNLSSIPWDEFYSLMKTQLGANFYGIFSKVVECYIGDNCSLTEISLELPENFHDEQSFFNCPLIDACFHGTVILYIQKNCKIVTDKVEGLRYYASNIPKNRDDHSSIFIYSTLKSQSDDLLSSSIVVMLEDGTVIIEVDNLVVKSLTPVKDPLLIETPCDFIYTPYLQTKDSQIQSPLEFNSIYQNNQENDNLLIPKVVIETIKPLINRKMEFRILEFGGNNLLKSTLLLNEINSLLEQNSHYEIDIEYTWSDNNSSILKDAKSELSKVDKGYLNILYRSLGLEVDNSLMENQKLNPSYYDLIIVSNISNLTNDIKYSLNQIYQILTPNGNLIINEQQLNNEESLKNLLVNCNFNSDIIMKSSSESDNKSIIIQAQKPSLKLQPKTKNTFDQVILYCNQDEQLQQQQQLINKFENHYNNNCKIIKVSTIEEFYKLSKTITNNSVIYFIKSIEQLTLENFKSVTFEYVQINQKLYELKSKCTHVLITSDSQSNNYLSSSIIGAARYFDEIPTLKLITLDFDKDSLTNDLNLLKTIDYLINPKNNIQREFYIKNNGTVYFEMYKKELKNLKNSYKSESYHDFSKQQDQLVSKLDEHFEYQLNSKQINLEPYEIEVKVKATGINYKDYLKYKGMIKVNEAGIGFDFSGIVSRVGIKSSKEFKVGDEVYGIAYETSSSHIIVDSLLAYHKPKKITHVQAASIPAVYSTSLYCLYDVGNLREGESVLIHSGSGGVGLSALEILKSNNHSSPIFVTVGSEEKKQYLINTYGNLISGIYSTRDTNYQKQIKNKLIELGYEQHGVDLILNTLSSEYMDTNFKCLNAKGRIVDLTTTHLNPNEFIDNSRYRYNIGYNSIEILKVGKSTIKKLLQSISKSIENETLNALIPITEFSNSNIKKSIESIKERKHVGKIVISHDTDIIGKLIEKESNIDYSILKSDYKIKNLGKNLLVTGQTGLILEILKWITKYNSTVENIIILSKSSLKWELEFLINYNKNKIKYHFKKCDISNWNLINKTIDQVLKDNPTITNIDSIFHFAALQINKKLKDIDMNSLNASHSAKTFGAVNLHNLSIKRDWKIINFILASSVVSVLGSFDQCSYVSACCVVDSLSQYRKSIGLPSFTINIGGVSDRGYLSRHKLVEAVLGGQGVELISPNQLLGTLDLQIQNPNMPTNAFVNNFNWPLFKSFKQKLHQKFDFILNPINVDNSISMENETTNQSAANIKNKFLNKVSELLSIDPSKINTNIKMINYGADSLITVQLKNWVDKEWSPHLITIQQIQSNSIGMVYQIINDSLDKKKKEMDEKLLPTIATTTTKTKNDPNDKTEYKYIAGGDILFWENQIKLDINNNNNNNNNNNENHNQKLIQLNNNNNNNNKNILLIGSIGILRTHLLFNLVKNSNCSNIYYILKDRINSINSNDEILNSFKQYKLYEQLSEFEISKIHVYFGDSSKNNFGLSIDEFNIISNNVNSIIINQDSDAVESTNSTYINESYKIETVKEIIKFSITNGIKEILMISSLYVNLGRNNNNINNNNSLNSNSVDFETLIPVDKISQLSNGSLQIKAVSEHLLKQASDKFNINTTIVRTPSIFSNPNDYVQLYLQSCIEIKSYPNIEFSFLTSPISSLSKTISNCLINIVESNKEHSCFNIINIGVEKPLQIENINNILGSQFNCEKVEYIEWFSLIQSSNFQSCIKLLPIQIEYTRYQNSFSQLLLLSNKSISESNHHCSKSKSIENIITNEMVINSLNNYKK